MDGEVLSMNGSGERIKQARLAKGLDQASLAGRLGVGIKSIYNWETERSVPTPENWARLALELERSVRWFQEGDVESDLSAKVRQLEERIESLERKING